MVFQIELLYLVAMLATFIVLLLVAKVPTGLSLMASAIVGAILSAIFSKTSLDIRYFIEGGFGYFDTILVIVCAMIFIKGLEDNGCLDYISASLVKIFKGVPTILILAFMIILMLPGMITGSSLSAVISAGAIVAPIMLKMGLPKAKVAAIIAFGAILGMIAPPINIPVMVICDVVDIPYMGFTLPLLLLTFPLAMFAALFLSRNFKKEDGDVKQNKLENIIILSVLGAVLLVFAVLIIVKVAGGALFNEWKYILYIAIIYAILYAGIVAIMLIGKPYKTVLDMEEMKEAIDFNVLTELKPVVLIPIILLVILFILQNVLPNIIGILGTSLLFVIAYIPSIFLGRKTNVFKTVSAGVEKSVSAFGLLIGVGMFVEIMTLNGVRGWFVINAVSLPSIWQYVSIVISMPIFGGISAFGSASILGGPFVMSMLSSNEIVVASALSLVAAIGEFLPPTAMSATFASKQVEEEKYLNVTKTSLIPLGVCLVWAMVVIILIAPCWPA